MMAIKIAGALLAAPAGWLLLGQPMMLIQHLGLVLLALPVVVLPAVLLDRRGS